MVQGPRPAILAAMIVGTNRENAQGVLGALDRQSCAAELLEIIVFDGAETSVPVLEMPARFASKYFRRLGLHHLRRGGRISLWSRRSREKIVKWELNTARIA